MTAPLPPQPPEPSPPPPPSSPPTPPPPPPLTGYHLCRSPPPPTIRYAPYKKSLFETFEELTDALNSSRFEGVTSLREHGRLLASELASLEAQHGGAAWHRACKAIFTAVFALAELPKAAAGKDVLHTVAACEEKEGVWEDALLKLADKQWKEPGEACSAETWEALGALIKGLEEQSERIDEEMKLDWVKRLGKKPDGRGGGQLVKFYQLHSKWLKKAPEALQASKEVATLKAELEAVQDAMDEVQDQLEEATDADSEDEVAGATRAKIVELLTRGREAGAPVTLEQAVWALKRTKGDTRDAAEMLDALPEARRVVAALRAPASLGGFDVGGVSPFAKKDVMSALRRARARPAW